jgi:hypothetical protein
MAKPSVPAKTITIPPPADIPMEGSVVMSSPTQLTRKSAL